MCASLPRRRTRGKSRAGFSEAISPLEKRNYRLDKPLSETWWKAGEHCPMSKVRVSHILLKLKKKKKKKTRNQGEMFSAKVRNNNYALFYASAILISIAYGNKRKLYTRLCSFGLFSFFFFPSVSLSIFYQKPYNKFCGKN